MVMEVHSWPIGCEIKSFRHFLFPNHLNLQIQNRKNTFDFILFTVVKKYHPMQVIPVDTLHFFALYCSFWEQESAALGTGRKSGAYYKEKPIIRLVEEDFVSCLLPFKCLLIRDLAMFYWDLPSA